MRNETKNVLDYLKAIAWVVVPFCLLGSLHYLFIFFPRAVCEKDNHILFNHLGFDYFGVVVGFFTLLITFLVGWNIYSTIKAKEEIAETKKDIQREFGVRVSHLQQDVDFLKRDSIKNMVKSTIKERNELTVEQKNVIKNAWNKVDPKIAETPIYKWLLAELKTNKDDDGLLSDFLRTRKNSPSVVTYIDGSDCSIETLGELIGIIRRLINDP